MAQVAYSAEALGHLERAFGFMLERDPQAAAGSVQAVASAVDALALHPLLGRRIDGEIRELVVSYGQTGYLVLYRFVVLHDDIRILAIRHQRELGYAP